MSNYGQKKLFHGVGINDADYIVERRVTEMVDGSIRRRRIFACDYYIAWKEMLRRACSEKFKLKEPCYRDVTVCPEWHRFSEFRRWMSEQDWQGKQLDKDILSPDSGKIYSPQTCCFISRKANLFTTHCEQTTSKLIGSTFDKASGKFKAQINLFGRRRTLGYFTTDEEAHLAWAKAKLAKCHELISSEGLEERVANAIIRRFQGVVDDAHLAVARAALSKPAGSEKS